MEHIDLSAKRHSLAHVLAMAVLEKYPEAKLTLGPAIDTGFYYDIDFGANKPTEDDLKELTKAMQKIVRKGATFSHKEVSKDEALAHFANNPYKSELIKEIAEKGEVITLYTTDWFTDLCRGGHVNDLKDVDPESFKLEKIAGAYWRGDEKNPMLTRIYGLAFETKDDLNAHITQQEEAKKRDHRKLGKELGLFVFSDLVGSGLPLWTVKGTIIREELQDFVWSLRKPRGYGKVVIPHITKQPLYEKSGHWAKYADDLFKIQTRDGHVFAMKPMNCPHHTQIFDSEQRSYRDMPQRYAESTMVYRDEQTGELSGLSRVISITQDDAHVFCRVNQIEDEVQSVWEIIQTFYSKFGFALTPRLSRRDTATPEKYLGKTENWDIAEEKLKSVIVKNFGDTYVDGVGEAAFYGPKIDFMAKDAIGRPHQVATIQLDFVQPDRFGLTCVNEKGEKEPVVMIHCAIMGSFERFLSVAIEHFAGAFPTWLSPVQVKVVPIGERQADFANSVHKALKDADVRVELDDSNDSLGKRIRNAKTEKVPYVIVLGDKEIESKILTIEKRDGSKIENISVEDFTQNILKEIKERTL
ncbi:MAG: threonine--tRNA ligase [Minisyncoccia bacterium]